MGTPSAVEWHGDRLRVRIQARPNARRDEVLGVYGETYRIHIAAPPREGRANEHLIRFLARAFGVPRTRVRIRTGTGARLKTVEIDRPARLPDWLTLPARDSEVL